MVKYCLFGTWMLALFSCSGADIVSGTYQGKMYRSDTIQATVKIYEVSEAFIRLEIGSDHINEAYIDYAQLEKNAENAYNLRLSDMLGGYILTGYYYEGYLHIDDWANQFSFDGKKD